MMSLKWWDFLGRNEVICPIDTSTGQSPLFWLLGIWFQCSFIHLPSLSLSHFSMTKEYKSLLYVLKHLSFNKMAKFISFFILVLLLLLSAAESSRSLSANTHKVSSPVSEFTVYLSTDGGCSLHVLIFVFQLVNLAGGIRHQWWWMLFRIRKWRVLD